MPQQPSTKVFERVGPAIFKPALAYLITFHTRGTWLRGDDRGWVNRTNNVYGRPRMAPDAGLASRDLARMACDPVNLAPEAQRLVAQGIAAACVYRDWTLAAANATKTHVHCVVAADCVPETVLAYLKARATFVLRQTGLVGPTERPWSKHGSTCYLWKEEHVAGAVDYVLNQQPGGVNAPGRYAPGSVPLAALRVPIRPAAAPSIAETPTGAPGPPSVDIML